MKNKIYLWVQLVSVITHITNASSKLIVENTACMQKQGHNYCSDLAINKNLKFFTLVF